MKPGMLPIYLMSAALVGALATPAVQAEPTPQKPGCAQGQMGMGHHGGGQYGHGPGKGAGRHHGQGMHHGEGGGHHSYGMHHGKGGVHHGGGKRWMKSLSAEQRQQVMQLRAAHKKQAMPRKARMKALKLELTALATADAPDSAAMDAKIDELLALKREAMKEKTAHMGQVRKLLTDEQKVVFDMAMMKKAMRSRDRGHRGRGH